MKKHFVAIEKAVYGMSYITDDLNSLISEMYECELGNGENFDVVKGWFFENHFVFESDSEIKEVSN